MAAVVNLDRHEHQWHPWALTVGRALPRPSRERFHLILTKSDNKDIIMPTLNVKQMKTEKFSDSARNQDPTAQIFLSPNHHTLTSLELIYW